MNDSSRPGLSVIVTSHNIEGYIGGCLEDMLAQTVDDLEVIVVDDGSTDASPQIITDHADRDDRIVPILFQRNSPGGMASVANAGLDRARGDWVGFADGDDRYDPTMFDKLLTAARDHEADLAMCAYHLLSEETGETTEPADAGRWAKLDGAVHDLDVATTKQFLAFSAVPWRKLYRRSLLEEHGLRFPVGDHCHEDIPFHWFTVMSADRIVTVPESLCHHRVARGGQAIESVDARLFKVFEHHDTIRRWLDRRQAIDAYGPTLLTWVITQMERTSTRTPAELRVELFAILRHVITQYDEDDIRASFAESSKGPRARALVDAVVNDSLGAFNSVVDNRPRTASPIASGLYHLRTSGLRETIRLARRYAAHQVHRARRIVGRRVRGPDNAESDVMHALETTAQGQSSVPTPPDDQETVPVGGQVFVVPQSSRAGVAIGEWADATDDLVVQQPADGAHDEDALDQLGHGQVMVLAPTGVTPDDLAWAIAGAASVIVVHDPEGADGDEDLHEDEWFANVRHVAELHDKVTAELTFDDQAFAEDDEYLDRVRDVLGGPSVIDAKSRDAKDGRNEDHVIADNVLPQRVGPLPNLLIVGAQKTGTTWLHRVLGKSEHIFATDVKELTHFNQGDALERTSLMEYRRHFLAAPTSVTYRLESTPHYFQTPDGPDDVDVAANIAHAVPDAELIVSFRDPVDRYESAYIHHMMVGRIPYVEEITELSDYMGMTTLGNYATHLRHWRRYFPDIIVLFHEDMLDDPVALVDGLMARLGLDNDITRQQLDFRTNDKKIKRRRQDADWDVMPRLDDDLRTKLREVYRDELADLQELTGRDLSHWM